MSEKALAHLSYIWSARSHVQRTTFEPFPMTHLFVSLCGIKRIVLGGDEWCVGKNALGSGLYGGLDTKRAAGQCPLLTTV